MKTLFLTTLAILLSIVIFAQTPQAFKYQAVIRNNQGKVLVSQIVSLRVSILQNDPLGSPVYIETHQIATNEYGIANLSIGSGAVVTGIFADIAWGTTTHYVKTELDITGNQNYEFIGTSQLLSVPYALYAEKAGNANDDMDKDSLNEIQQLSLNANELSISKGNTIMLPPDNDHDTLNEIQALSLNGNQLTISKGNTITFTGAVDLDADPVNEIQIISISNDTIYLTNGGFLKLPKEIDADTTNELQALNYSNDTLYLSKGNFLVLPHNFDNDSTNEIQTLSISNDTIFLSGSNNIVLPRQNSVGGSGSVVSVDMLNNNFSSLYKLSSNSYLTIKDISVFDNNTIYIIGDFLNPNTDFCNTTISPVSGVSDYDVFMAKLDSNYNIVWIKIIGSSDSDQAVKCINDNSGNVYYVCKMRENAVINDNATVYIVNSTGYDTFIIKYSPSGILQWVKQSNASEYLEISDIEVDSIGEIYVSGLDFGSSSIYNTTGSSKSFIAKQNSSNGSIAWVKNFNNGAYTYFTIINDNIFLPFCFYNNVTFDITNFNTTGADMLLLKLDLSGDILNSKIIVSPMSSEEIRGVESDSDGNIYFSGRFSNGNLIFGASTLTPNYFYNCFLAKFDNNLNIIWAKQFGSYGGYIAIADMCYSNQNIILSIDVKEGLSFNNNYYYSYNGGSSSSSSVTYNEIGNFIDVEFLKIVSPPATDLGSFVLSNYQNKLYIGFSTNNQQFVYNNSIYSTGVYIAVKE